MRVLGTAQSGLSRMFTRPHMTSKTVSMRPNNPSNTKEVFMADVAVKKAEEKKSDEKAVTKRSEGELSRLGVWEPSSWLSPSEFFSNPFSVMRRFSEEMDRTFGRFFNRETGGESFWSPAIEVSESDGQLKVHAELPGLKPEDVRVEVTEDQLVIQGERKYEHRRKRKASIAPSGVTANSIGPFRCRRAPILSKQKLSSIMACSKLLYPCLSRRATDAKSRLNRSNPGRDAGMRLAAQGI